jgi:hypothetical protein
MPVIARTRLYRTASALIARAAVEAKRRIVEQVIAGRLSLVEGAAHFRATSGDGGPDGHDIEGSCRTVLGWAGLELRDRPERAAAVVGRLEAELEWHLRRLGAAGRCRA